MKSINGLKKVKDKVRSLIEGALDERWLASTTPATNDNREPDEGLSYVTHCTNRFPLAQAVKITIDPGAFCSVKDGFIRFGELMEGVVFCTEAGTKAGVTFTNTSTVEPLVACAILAPASPPMPQKSTHIKVFTPHPIP